MVKVKDRVLTIPTLRRAKAEVESHFPNVFDNDIPLSERVDAVIPCDEELLYLFQFVEVFLATRHGGTWRKFQERNFARYIIQDGFMLLYDKKLKECKALLDDWPPRPVAPKRPSFRGLTFSGMRKMNGCIPSHLLVTGRRTELYFSLAKLVPEDYSGFCETYYILSVYEELIKDRMIPPEKLERILQYAWDMLAPTALYCSVYCTLRSSTPEGFVKFMDSLLAHAKLDGLLDKLYSGPF